MNRNQLAAAPMTYGAMNVSMGWISYAMEAKTQVHYKAYNGGIYVNKTREKAKRLWKMNQ